MKIVKNPNRSDWASLLERPTTDVATLLQTIQPILDAVKTGGDEALKEYNKKFDGYGGDQLVVSEEELDQAENQISAELKVAILLAKENINKFHRAQQQETFKIETMPGVFCSRKSVPIERVGLYIPGGTAPLFSTVLMLGVPAQIAGCKEIVLCTPPDENGQIHPAIVYAAKLVGVTKIVKVGGAQAIAAMAYGTTTVPKVFKIFGPGNQYVTAAKQLVNTESTAIDMPAGPSEVAILADAHCIPAFVAADLLSQAEHGVDSQVVLVSTDEEVIIHVKNELDKQLMALPRREIAAKSLENSIAIVVADEDEAIALLNDYGAEHLILAVQNDEDVAGRIINAGSVFLGNFSPESVGDYASGTNHTLPTNGYAKAYSGVSLDSFVKKITYQKLTEQGILNLGTTVEIMAEAEALEGHKNAVSVRLKYLKDQGDV